MPIFYEHSHEHPILNQKTCKGIRILHSLKHKHSNFKQISLRKNKC